MTIWDGRISPVFDVCREVLLLAVEHGTETGRTHEALRVEDFHAKIDRLVELGVQTLVCGAISAPARDELLRRGVEVIPFVAGEVAEVLRAFLAGDLPHPAFAMPGCGGRQRRFRGGRGRGRLSRTGHGRSG